MSYIWGFVLAVPEAKRDAYIESAAKSWPMFKEYGALFHGEYWEAKVPEGKVTSFPMAVKREPGEAVVFSWVAWPDQAAAEACEASFDTDPRWQDAMSMDDMPFDGKRMIFGGFAPVFEASA